MRLAIFVDQIYWFDGQAYSTDESYVLFPASFTSAFDQVVFIGRLAPERARKPYVLDNPSIQFCPLPYYQSVYHLWKQGSFLYNRIRQIVQDNAQDWDVVWVCGPNPIGQVIAEQCVDLGRPVFLVVRQNLVRQMSFANRGLRRMLAMATAWWLERRFRRLARGRTVFCVGHEMTQAYRTVTERVHLHVASLIGQTQMATLAALPHKPEPDRLLCVGRLSSEKGYHHVLTALALLKSRGLTCSLDIAGSGPDEDVLQGLASALGLQTRVTFHGYVPYGPDLLALYQKAAALVVPSLTEGLPQVIVEALCAGLPIIASAVGGVPAFLTDRETALLVPPADPLALSQAIELLLRSPELRERLRRNGETLVRNNSLEAERDRIIQIIRQEVLCGPSPFRSALTDHPGHQLPSQPAVSAIVPVRNEMSHIQSIVESLLAQDYPGLTEMWFVDGESDDGTFEELERLKQRDSRIRILRNPRRNQSAALNLAFAQAQGDVVIRLDGHAKYEPDVVRQSVEALLETGAGGVGAIARPMSSQTLIGQSIAAAHVSKLGVGMAKFRQECASGWVDTVWNGCYWKYIVDRVGPLREDLLRTEDNDFNARVRALGYGLYLSPKIKAYYYPRQSLGDLWRQYSANGAGVIQTWIENRKAIGLHHLVPLVFVGSLLVFLLGSLVVWPHSFLAAMSILLAYLAAVVASSVVAWRKQPGQYVLLLPLVFFTLHISYGLGSMHGLAQWVFRALRNGLRVTLEAIAPRPKMAR